jgi:hypothetical protein
MISELGTVRDITYLSSEEESEEAVLPAAEGESADIPEVSLGPLFERPAIYPLISRRRFRVRSSSVI